MKHGSGLRLRTKKWKGCVDQARKNGRGTHFPMSGNKSLFIGLCILVGVLPLCVTSVILNGIELLKLLVLFLGTGVLVSIRVWQSGS